MDLYEYDKYVIDIDNCKKTLNKYGVAIIPNVLTETECKKMVSGVWKFFEDITKNTNNEIKKKDKNTRRNMFNLFPMHFPIDCHAFFIYSLYIFYNTDCWYRDGM